MVLCFAPFALYVSEEVSVLHATAAVKAVVHVTRIVFHEVAALWAYGVKYSVKLEHVSDQVDPLEFVLSAKASLFLFPLGFCVLSKLFEAAVIHTVPAVSKQVAFLLNLVHSLSAVKRSSVVVHDHSRLTIRVYVVNFL